MPDWLRGAADAAPAPAGDVPDWLRGDQPSSAAPPSAPANEVPDWLRGAADTAPVAPAPSGDVPDWLSGSSDSAPVQPAASDVPDWLGSPESSEPPAPSPVSFADLWSDPPTAPPAQPPSPQTSSATEPDEEGVPSWLRDVSMDEVRRVMESDSLEGISATPFTFEGSTGPSTAQPSGDAPSWLGGTGSETSSWLDTLGGNGGSTANQEQEQEPDAPVWLRDLDQPSAPSTPPAPAAPPAPPTGDVPSWLQDVDQSAASGPATPVAPAADAAPDWLRESTSSAPSPSVPSAGADEAVPSWLRESAPAAETDVPDWLSAGTPSAAVPSTSAADEGIPAWLREAAPTSPAALAQGADVPDWLSDTAPSAPTPSAPSADEGVPSWLREAAPSEPVVPATPTASAPAADEGVPSWLREAVPTTPAAPTAPAAPVSGGDVPPWLRESTAAPAEDVPSWLNAGPSPAPVAPASPSVGAPPPASAPAASEVPDWLSAEIPTPTAEDQSDLPVWLRQAEPTGGARQTPPSPVQPPAQLPASPAEAITAPLPSAPPAASPAGPAEDLPPWLRDESGAPLPTAGAPGDAGLPTWLRGATLDEAAPARPAPQQPQQPAAPNLNWFEDAPPAAPAQGAAGNESEFLGATDLPAWLRATTQQPEAPPPEAEPADARSLDWLRRLGGQEEEAPVAVAAPTARLAPPTAPARTESHLMAVALLERLAANPFPEAAPLPQPAQPTRWERIGLERVLYVVLLVVLMAALAVPSLSAPLQVAPVDPSASRLYEQISRLGSQDVVLIGSEWDVRRVGELRPLQQVVIRQLIEQQVKMVLVSTNPQGSLLLYDLRDELARAGYPPGASDYILLGYRPGGELALRLLAQDLRGALRSDAQGQDTTQGGLANGVATKGPLNSIADFSMILVLADDAASVQGWMEQVHPAAPQVPIGLIQPAETGALTQPYSRLQNVFSLTGKSGALAYGALREGNPVAQEALQGAGQLRLALLVFAVLFVLGGVVVLVGSTAKRRKKAA